MGRIALALSVVVSAWLGSAIAAEAQSIQPIGPMSVTAGSSVTTFQANIYLPTPCPYKLHLDIYRAGALIHTSDTIYPKPAGQNSTLSKDAALSAYVYSGDVLTFVSSIRVGTVWYNASNWLVTVTGTRPTKTDSFQKSDSLQKRSTLAVQFVERDRRRE